MELRHFETEFGTITYWISYAPDSGATADIAACLTHPENTFLQNSRRRYRAHTIRSNNPRNSIRSRVSTSVAGRTNHNLYHQTSEATIASLSTKLNASRNETPWLVFLPGLTADHRLFKRQISYFKDKANCLIWDPPAHGKSRPFSLNFSLTDLAHMLRGILEHERITFPILVGQSMGGYVSQAYLQEYPYSLQGFVSIDSAPLQRTYYRPRDIKALKHTTLMYKSIPWGALLRAGSKGCSTTLYGQNLMREMMNSYTKQEYCELAGHGFKILAEAIEKDLPYAVNCPTLLLWGEKDQAGKTKQYNQQWALQTGFSFVEIPGAGHNANTDAVNQVNKQIEIFIQGLVRPPSEPTRYSSAQFGAVQYSSAQSSATQFGSTQPNPVRIPEI